MKARSLAAFVLSFITAAFALGGCNGILGIHVLDDPLTGDGGADGSAEAMSEAGGCGPATCPDGCCDPSGTCLGPSSQSHNGCGTAGAVCAACAPGETCSNATCSCGGAQCAGCCSDSNTCVTTTGNAACGANGTACTACPQGQECNPEGQCVCDSNSCPSGCCDAAGHCQTPSTATCGNAGGTCVSCAAGQECSTQGLCVCNAKSCPNGCCDSNGQCVPTSAQSTSACGTGGAACGTCVSNEACSNGVCSCGGGACNGCCSASDTCVTSTNSSACGANGVSCVACPQGQECSAQGQCVCDAQSCPNGCCDASGKCQALTNTTCGAGGKACVSCPGGQECNSQGQCVCDATSCAHGCCNGGASGSCEAYASQSASSCGSAGATCTSCSNGLCDTTVGVCACDSNTCPAGCCNGGASGSCEPYASQSASSCGAASATCTSCSNGLCDTTAGMCRCDSNTCPAGCCNGGATGTCEPYQSESIASCGTGGTTCSACGGGATSCTTGECECNGSAACSSTETCCNTGCADLVTDANNCGACGHSCEGGSCSNGQCQPIVLGTFSGPGAGLTLDASNVYFTNGDGGTLFKCPKTGCPGGSATALYTLPSGADAAQVVYDAATNVLFLSDNTSRIVSLSPSGSVNWEDSGTSSPMNPWGVALDSTYVYTANAGGVTRIPKANGAVQSVETQSGYVDYVAMDTSTNTLFATVSSSPGAVFSCGANGCGSTPTQIGGSGGSVENPLHIVVAGGYVYWTAEFSGSSGVYYCPTSGCTSPSMLAAAANQDGAITVDGNYAYWDSYAFNNGSIVKCALAPTGCGGHPSVISPDTVGMMPNQLYTIAIANDANCLYWINPTGQLLKVAK